VKGIYMEDNLLHIPQMLLIGSTGRNSGKTTLAIAFIKRWMSEHSIVGLKVTTIHEGDGQCPRGGNGCGVCSNILGEYEILQEENENTNKDTSLLLAAGAEKVYWIKTQSTHISTAIKRFMELVPRDTLIICESNSLRHVIKPGSFIMLTNSANSSIKKTAREVMKDADAIIDFSPINGTNTILRCIDIEKNPNGHRIIYNNA
jgi:hypothetical protein